MALVNKAELLRVQLGIEPGTPIHQIVKSALAELGLEKQYGSCTLVEQVDIALQTLGVGSQEPPMAIAMGEVVAYHGATSSAQIVPVIAQPVAQAVAQPIAPVAATPPPANNNRPPLAPGLKDASEIAGCWGCFCIPGGFAIEAKQADGPDVLVHKGVGWLPICPFGLPFEDRWVRIPGSNVFRKEGADDKLDYGPSSCCVCLGGLGMSCKVGPACCGIEHRKIPAHELEGQWCCACVPGGWACFRKESRGEDTIQHKGCAFILGALPVPVDEPWDRVPNLNTFAKRGDPNSKNVYLHPGFVSHGLLGCDMRLGK